MRNLFILMLLISFGSIGAVFFTPGLPEIAAYFHINSGTAELTVTWYLIGYACGQLLYGPMAHSLGSNNTIRLASLLTMAATMICITAGIGHSFTWLLIGRLLMACGAGAGLKMTMTLSTYIYNPRDGARAMSLITMAFAFMPGFGVFIGGFLVNGFGWISSFYLMLVYGLVIFLCSFLLPEIYHERESFDVKGVFRNYLKQFSSLSILSGGFLLGVCSGRVYIFAAIAPFIAMKLMHLSPEIYGSYNLIPVIGTIVGSLLANYYGKFYDQLQSLKLGLIITTAGVVILLGLLYFWPTPLSLFVPMMIINLGASFIWGNASSLSLSTAEDKSNASAVISFINMGSSCLLVLMLNHVHVSNALILPVMYIVLAIIGMICYKVLTSLALET